MGAFREKIGIFDATQQKAIYAFPIQLRALFGLLAQQNNNVIAAGTDGLEVWDIKKAKSKGFIKTETLRGMCAFGDEHAIAGIDRRKDELFVYDLRVKDILQHTIKLNQSGGRVVRAISGHVLATGGDDATVKFWDIRKCSKEKCLSIQTYGIPVEKLDGKGVRSFCLVGNKIAAMHYNNMLSIWNNNTGKREYFIRVVDRVKVRSTGGVRALNDRFIVFPFRPYRTLFQAKNFAAVDVFDVTTGRAIVHCEQKIANIYHQDESIVLHNNMFTALGQKAMFHSNSWTAQIGKFAQLVQWDFTKIVDAYSGKYPLDKMQELLAKARDKKELVATLFSD